MHAAHQKKKKKKMFSETDLIKAFSTTYFIILQVTHLSSKSHHALPQVYNFPAES